MEKGKREGRETHWLIETNAETAVDALAVEARDDALPERGGAFLLGDGGGGAEQATVLGPSEIPGDGLLLQLQPDLGRVEGDRGDLREGRSIRLNQEAKIHEEIKRLAA